MAVKFHDVVAGEIYDLIVEITNTSSRPALYTSLELFVGGQAELYLDVAVFDVDAADTYLLCSDGLYREVELDGCIGMLRDDAVDAIAEALLSQCLASAARDNESLVVARPAGP